MSKKIDLHLNLARDLPHVDADSAQMQHVIMNLVINASEATFSRARSSSRTWVSRRLRDSVSGRTTPSIAVCFLSHVTGHLCARGFFPF